MGVMHLQVPFPGDLPAITTIVEQLNLLVEEAVHYEEARWQLVCPATHSEFGLYPGDENEYILTSFYLKPTYLVDATLVILQDLGGTFSDSLPQWARQPWRVAKNYY